MPAPRRRWRATTEAVSTFPSSFLGRFWPSLARLPWFDAVVPDFLELLVEELLLPRALGLEAADAIQLFFAHLPGLLGHPDVGAEDDVSQLVSHQTEVPLGDMTDQIARLVVQRVELDLVLGDAGVLQEDLS